MAKVVAVYTILATAFVILLLLPTSPKSSHKVGHRRIRLNPHLVGSNGPQFDPLVAKMEFMAEEKKTLSLMKAITNVIGYHGNNNNNNNSNNNDDDNNNNDNNNNKNSKYGHVDHNDVYKVDEIEVSDNDEDGDEWNFGEDGKLNLAWRLKLLFGMIDNLPMDGQVEFKELHSWILMQAKERLASTTRIQLLAHDLNKDSHISFQEYFPQFSSYDIEKNGKEYGEAGWWMEQFTIADVDNDNLLNFEEFQDFLHPEDSKNEDLQIWFIRRKISTMDWNGDGKLNFWEFHDNAYDTYSRYYQFSTGEEYVPPPEVIFADLDLDRDRWLTVQELLPIRQFLFPGELDYASYNTTYLINEVDDDRSGTLTIDEMLNHRDKFYNVIYVEEDEDDYYELHDEF